VVRNFLFARAAYLSRLGRRTYPAAAANFGYNQLLRVQQRWETMSSLGSYVTSRHSRAYFGLPTSWARTFIWCMPSSFRPLGGMKKSKTVGLSYAPFGKSAWRPYDSGPGARPSGIQIIRDNSPAGFSVRVTLYGEAEERVADRAMNCVQREKQRHFHLTE
jgi:hypothetical protein